MPERQLACPHSCCPRLDAYGAQDKLTRTARGSKRDLLASSAMTSSHVLNDDLYGLQAGSPDWCFLWQKEDNIFIAGFWSHKPESELSKTMSD